MFNSILAAFRRSNTVRAAATVILLAGMFAGPGSEQSIFDHTKLGLTRQQLLDVATFLGSPEPR
jgi:hypothetical protein